MRSRFLSERKSRPSRAFPPPTPPVARSANAPQVLAIDPLAPDPLAVSIATPSRRAPKSPACPSCRASRTRRLEAPGVVRHSRPRTTTRRVRQRFRCGSCGSTFQRTTPGAAGRWACRARRLVDTTSVGLTIPAPCILRVVTQNSSESTPLVLLGVATVGSLAIAPSSRRSARTLTEAGLAAIARGGSYRLGLCQELTNHIGRESE